MKFKLTSLEKKWVLYDVGNSAFTMMVSTIFPIYFNSLAESAGISDVNYLAYWGYATSICTLIVALLGPTLGAVADTKNFKKIVFSVAMGVGVFGCILLGFLSSWLWFLGIFVLAKTGYSASLIFYDAMLTDVTEPDRMDSVSSHGYAWGYIGSCIPFVICLGIVLGGPSLGLDMQLCMILAFIITALWWLMSSVPLLKSYKQKYYSETGAHVVRDSFKRLGKTFVELAKEKHIFVFLLAFFFYIDGVLYGDRHGHGIRAGAGARQYGASAGAPGDTDRCVPERADLQSSGEEEPAGDHHHHLHRRVFLHRGLCVLAGYPVRLLAAGDSGWHVSGDDSGAVPVLFRQDHPGGEVRRVFWDL